MTNLKQIEKNPCLPDIRDFIKPFLHQSNQKEGNEIIYKHYRAIKGSKLVSLFLKKEKKWLSWKKICHGIHPFGCCLKTNCPLKSRNTVYFLSVHWLMNYFVVVVVLLIHTVMSFSVSVMYFILLFIQLYKGAMPITSMLMLDVFTSSSSLPFLWDLLQGNV